MRLLNGSVTDQGGWEFATGHLDPEGYKSPQDLRDYWDSMVLNYWPVVTLVVNATYGDGNAVVPDAMARMFCVAPNCVDTGKAFSFSVVVPAVGNLSHHSGHNDHNATAKNSACPMGTPRSWGWVMMAILTALSV
ncbi:hypothetical protein B0H67DRAFT_576556 [Lasiosphaeris hirsuta]|uniref:Uncharacterized protein n=1 Tax=Lasiosphaeris hirsuta TaxID=260670 RepID=A0AA40E2T1_9PEZI|nr:hypothetical protein B0H67DRAFT_576556 [Lasiosphaeris hirsuta]